jgi:hypothetical protein
MISTAFRMFRAALLALAAALVAAPAAADPWLRPGDPALRSDLHTLADRGVLHVPLTTWPLPWASIVDELSRARVSELDLSTRAAYERVNARAELERRGGTTFHTLLGVAEKPRVIRTFDDTPREDGQIGAGLAWAGERFSVRLNATRMWDPADGDTVRPDGSYIGAALGNWRLSIGYPERWWGPGWDGSLILSSNARPIPQVAIERERLAAPNARWLRWIGPWTLNSFVGRLDDERDIDDTLLFALRLAFRPLPRLEVGLSRTAQWCGDERPCDADTFVDLLTGRDNRGVNVAEDDEPGNQLAGFDLRWSPFDRGRAAFYMQWIGEDSRQGGPQIGSWLRQLGMEVSGAASSGRWSHRTHIEIAETICREGGFGSSDEKPRCAYEHSIYTTGYRYERRSIGHGIDGDGRAYTVGSTLTRDDSRVWRLSLRHLELNRTDAWFNTRHTLTPTPQNIAELTVMHSRALGIGALRAAVGYRRLDDRFDSRLDDGSLFGWLEFVVN